MTHAGIDVGSSQDLTALVVLDGRKVAALAQLPRGMALAAQAAELAPLVADTELSCVDATGLGLGLAEALRGLGARIHFAVFITGREVNIAPSPISRIRVGKHWLVQRLAVAIGTRALDIPDTDLGRELIRQLGNMTARITSSGGVKLEAPGVAADDMAMALALALLAQDMCKKGVEP